jgi:anti-anti-sigma factor
VSAVPEPGYSARVTPPAFQYELDEGRGVLALQGELDDPASTELRNAIAKATGELRSDLTVDLGKVTFMPSPAIGVLATSQAKALLNGATITFVAPEGSVAARLLTICSLDYVAALD